MGCSQRIKEKKLIIAFVVCCNKGLHSKLEVNQHISTHNQSITSLRAFLRICVLSVTPVRQNIKPTQKLSEGKNGRLITMQCCATDCARHYVRILNFLKSDF